ncbi:hypothetical protein [Zunongwangia sp. HGR-M22]|uniref:hypothetical protein n=1 Tax=Zunongwangia sp. HGR-M22 TaxID=3015168 RepID=UPI0022DD04FD|nr:hypothetical protein [Zunongwangia sp. HGR-M22]WBL25130.1 hypothetical protein PBT91_14650 [Zunongwangia sp. HGR-M22]
MIYIQTDTFQIDISRYGVSLNEESDLFTDSVNKNYSLPFTIEGDAELLNKLGLLHLGNASDVDIQIPCRLILPDRHYKANLFIGDIQGKKIECTITYGDEDLAVYDIELKNLPWPQIISVDLPVYARNCSRKSWPSTAFNFPMVWKPSITEEDNYEAFEGFLNNFQNSKYVENEIDNSGEEPKYLNKNVMAPMPYLLEILRFIYAQEGKKVFGEAVEHPDLKKALYIPENYLEKFRGSEYLQWSFSDPKSNLINNNKVYSLYEQLLSPTEVGNYEIDYTISLDPVQARYFEFKIYRQDSITGERSILKEAKSTNNRVKLDDKFSITIEKKDIYDKIVVQLILENQNQSIADTNNFEYSFEGGRLNQFPSVFSLSNFVPDMTAGEYINLLKNWWNLDIDVQERFVIVNFAQNSVLDRKVRDHSHLEDPKKKFVHNTNRFYKLSYTNGETYFYNKNGRVFSNLLDNEEDEIKIELDLQPALVEPNKGIITAVAPEESSDLDFCLYGGLENDLPVCSENLSRALSLDNVGSNFWETWLWFRIHSKTFKDSIECSTHEIYDIKELSFKYNEKQIIKKISKKFQSEKVMKVEVESEAF